MKKNFKIEKQSINQWIVMENTQHDELMLARCTQETVMNAVKTQRL